MQFWCWLQLIACLTVGQSWGATRTLFTNDFEAYTTVATSLADTADADPTDAGWGYTDNPAGGTAGSGVQVIDWLAHSSSKALLIRSGALVDIPFQEPLGGNVSYQFDYWLHVHKAPGDRSFRVTVRGEGGDVNVDDYFAYGSLQSTAATIRYYDGIDNVPVAGYWSNTPAVHIEDTWQHHRVVVDTAARTMSLYIDDMVSAVVTNVDLGRPDVPVPVGIRFQHEGNSADDGYFVVDDITCIMEDIGTRSLAATFREGFETYTARTNPTDDADPPMPWLTMESVGAGAGRPLAPEKVQVVDASVVTPRSGTNCIKLEGGQRANISYAWGVPPQADVQITWWARVPASPTGGEFNYLRMSLYGAEGGSSLAGDSALLGYACRQATLGTATSLTYYTTAWQLSGFDFSPDTWEEYRLTTHNSVGRYTIIKNPSSANPVVVVDRAPYIGAAATWGPTFMVAWSSSNGSGHPPVYVDDIEIKSIVSNPDPLPTPYTVQFNGTRFTNATTIPLTGPIGAVAVDPRDNSTIVFTVDAASGGAIYKATKVATGNWSVDSTPLVTGLSNPSGVTIATNGTIWWTHDFTTALMRLKSPWSANSPELVISDFILPGATTFGLDDDTFDLRFAPASFNGTLGKPHHLVLMDRGVDDNPWNTLFFVDPATSELNQVNFDDYLYGPTTTGLGGGDLVGMTTLPASGEIVTLNFDGQVTAVNADGAARSFWPDFYSDPLTLIAPASIATDPLTGRLWITDDLTNQVWSCTSDGTSGQRELSFPLTNPERTERQIDFQEPGMVFAPDGSFMVLSDTSTVNGGGRLIIFHNEAISLPSFSISTVARVAQGVQLVWQSAGSARYDVLRGADVANAAGFQSIATNLTTAQFTDTNAPAGAAFYRVIARP